MSEPPHPPPSPRRLPDAPTTFDEADVGLLVFDADGRFAAVNRAAADLLGRPAPSLIGRRLGDVPWERASGDGSPIAVDELPVARTLRTGARVRGERLGIRTAGGRAWLEVTSAPVRLDDGTPGALCTLRDVTRDLRASRAYEQQTAFRDRILRLSQRALETRIDERFFGLVTDEAVATIPGAQASSVLVREEGGTYAFVAATNYDLDALRRARLREEELSIDPRAPGVRLVRGYDNSGMEPERRAILEGPGRADELKVSLVIPVVEEGELVAFFAVDNFDDADAFSDEAVAMARLLGAQLGAFWHRRRLESELAERQARLEYLAYYDPLTGLPNRRLLQDRIAQALTRARRNGTRVGIALLDLDAFKDVNDRYGHGAGDELLRVVARRLTTSMRASDTLARWGGDEFVVVMHDLAEPEDAVAVVRRMLPALDAPVRVAGNEVRVRASVGVDVPQAPDASPEDTFRRADIALYRAKGSGRNRIVRFDEGMDGGGFDRQRGEPR